MSEPFILDTRKPDPERKLVRINDYAYHVSGLTRNVTKRLTGLQAKAAALQKAADEGEVDADELAYVLIDAISVQLRPENQGQKDARDLLRDLWESEEDELTLNQLRGLQDMIDVKAVDLERPPV